MDAKTNAVTAVPELPWYLTALLVSQPLHFGDYGGMPIQILWALLDVATVIVLGSGQYLWLKRGKTANVHVPRKAAPWPLWDWPIALGVLTAIVLVSALFSDGGLGDGLAWVSLVIPVATGLRFGWGRRR